ncbi:unnamed protein product, partial [Amoebophrya sp. A120]
EVELTAAASSSADLEDDRRADAEHQGFCERVGEFDFDTSAGVQDHGEEVLREWLELLDEDDGEEEDKKQTGKAEAASQRTLSELLLPSLLPLRKEEG